MALIFTSDNGGGTAFNAGSPSRYSPGSMTYLDEEHVYLIRLADGSFVALYDWDPKAQSRYAEGHEEMLDCRVEVLAPDEEAYEANLTAMRGLYEPVAGVEDVVLRGCYGSKFDALGRRVFGPAPADLDRFPVGVGPNGDVIINLAERDCKEGSPCLPYR